MKARARRVGFFHKWVLDVVLTPLRLLKDFFTRVPDEVSLTDTVGEAFSDREARNMLWQALVDHFVVLRNAVFRCFIVLVLTTVIGFSFATKFMSVLAVPLKGEALVSVLKIGTFWGTLEKLTEIGTQAMAQLQVIEPTEAIEIFMRVSLLAGVTMAMPWFVLELFLFIAPGVMPRTRILTLAFIPIATILFISGMAFTYLLMLPTAVPFLRDFMLFRFAWRPSAYFNLVTSLMFWIGLVFEMPLMVYALALAGWVRAVNLAKYWRFAVAGIAVLAAVITPTPDPVNMTIVMIPLSLLYGISVLVAWVGEKSVIRRKKNA